MATIVLPKGQAFRFYLNVKDKNSFLAQNLSNMTSAVFTVFKYDNVTTVFADNLTVIDALNGILACDLSSSQTNLLDAYTAPDADRAYLKSKYHATIVINFSDGTDTIHVYVDQIYVSPSGA